MNFMGVTVSVDHVPELDPLFIPLGKFNQAFLSGAKKPLDIALERANGQVAVYRTFIHGTPEMQDADRYYVRRMMKTMLWL